MNEQFEERERRRGRTSVPFFIAEITVMGN
jgi:hypothetical protein